MAEQNTKMVIVMRTDLNMRKGKMVAQGAHAAMAILTKCPEYPPILRKWLEKSYTKVCVGVDSKEELVELYDKAKKAGVLCSLIVDNGQTEFKGIPTATCAAIGPDYCEAIDVITGGLKLL